MSPDTDFSSSSFLRRSYEKIRRFLNTLVYKRTVLLLTIIFCAGTALLVWHLVNLSAKLVHSTALEGAARYSEALAEFRTLYTSEVVTRAQAAGVRATHELPANPGRHSATRYPQHRTRAPPRRPGLGRRSPSV